MPFQFRPSDRRAWSALVLLLLVSLPAVTTRIYASDEIEYFAYLRSLWFDHDVSFDNEYRYFYDRGLARSEGFHETFLEQATSTGLRKNYGTLGSALLWAPFYAVGDAAAHLARAAGRSVAVDGFSFPYVAAVCYGSVFYGFAAIVLAVLASRRVLATGGDTWLEHPGAGLAVWLGTPLLFYMYLAPAFSHATSAFAVAAFTLAWLDVRTRWSARGLAVLGMLGALMTMVREQDAFFMAGPAVDFAWTLVSGQTDARQPPQARWRLLGHLAIGCLAGLAAFAPQALAYLALNGRIAPSPDVSRKMTWWSPHAFQVLLSPEHGFFLWTPLAVLGLAGLALLWRRGGPARRMAAGLTAMVASQVYIAGCVGSWSVEGAFGHRRFVGVTIVLVIGLAALVRHARSSATRRCLGVALALCVWWNIALMVQFGSGLMDRHRLELGRNAYQAFVSVPIRMPSLAWRYLFDRASFYKATSGVRP